MLFVTGRLRTRRNCPERDSNTCFNHDHVLTLGLLDEPTSTLDPPNAASWSIGDVGEPERDVGNTDDGLKRDLLGRRPLRCEQDQNHSLVERRECIVENSDPVIVVLEDVPHKDSGNGAPVRHQADARRRRDPDEFHVARRVGDGK